MCWIFLQGDYMKAERIYKDVMKRVMSKGVAAEDNSMIEMSLKLAKVYASWQQHDKAVLGFQFCIKTQEKKVKNGMNFTKKLLELGYISYEFT